MILHGTNISFEIPISWQHFADGSRLVLHGTSGEELIVSGSKIEGKESEAELATIMERLFQGAVKSAEDAASHPDLVVTQTLDRDPHNQEIDCWTLRSRTTSGDTLFIESVVRSAYGVTLITYQAPNTVESEEIYVRFIRSMRVTSKEA